MLNIQYLGKEIYVVENFLSNDECDSIVNYLDMIVKNGWLDWNQISFYGSLAMGYWPYDDNLLNFNLPRDYFNQLKLKVKNISEKAIETELSEISYHAQKWITGAFADYHSDNSDEHGNPTAFQRSKYAAFIYLNDDFEGGYLKFKDSEINLKPKKGMIAIFNGGHKNQHMVTTITSGERYTVGSFWDRADSVYSDEQRQAWADELAGIRADQEITYKKWAEDKEKGIVPVLPENE